MWSCRDSLKNWYSFQTLAATKGKQRHEGCQPALCNLWARACCASDFEGRQHIPQLWMPKPSGVSAGEKPSQGKADVLQQISLRSPAATAPTSPLLHQDGLGRRFSSLKQIFSSHLKQPTEVTHWLHKCDRRLGSKA